MFDTGVCFTVVVFTRSCKCMVDDVVRTSSRLVRTIYSRVNW